MKVLMPAKCGSSPRANVGMSRSTIDLAAGSPSSRPRATSASQAVVGSVPSLMAARQPLVDGLSGSGRIERVGTDRIGFIKFMDRCRDG